MKYDVPDWIDYAPPEAFPPMPCAVCEGTMDDHERGCPEDGDLDPSGEFEQEERAATILRSLYRGRKLLAALAVSEQDLHFLASELGIKDMTR